MREIIIVQENDFSNEHGKTLLSVLKNITEINKEDRIEFNTNMFIENNCVVTQCFNEYLRMMQYNGVIKIIIQK